MIVQSILPVEHLTLKEWEKQTTIDANYMHVSVVHFLVQMERYDCVLDV